MFQEMAVKGKVRICKPGGQHGTVFPANPLGETFDNKTKVGTSKWWYTRLAWVVVPQRG